MHYLIDGYNLLFRCVKARESEDLKTQREEFVKDIAKKIHAAHLDATLIFDSQYQAGPGDRFSIRDLDIQFTDEGETADDRILAHLKKAKSPKDYTVVSSDGRLAWQARIKGAHSLTVEDFIPYLHRIYKKKIKGKLPSPPLLKPAMPERQPTQEERYEKIFEEKLETEPLPTSKELSKSYEKRPRKKKVSKPTISDYERWLKAFEKEDGA